MKGGLHDSQIRSDSCRYPSKHRGRAPLSRAISCPPSLSSVSSIAFPKSPSNERLSRHREALLPAARIGHLRQGHGGASRPGVFPRQERPCPRLFVRASRGESDLGGLRFLDRQSAGRGCDPTGNGRRRLCLSHRARTRGSDVSHRYRVSPICHSS